MKLKIGDLVVTNKDIAWDGGGMLSGTVGEVANIVEVKTDEKYIIFNPQGTEEMFIIKLNSVEKLTKQ